MRKRYLLLCLGLLLPAPGLCATPAFAKDSVDQCEKIPSNIAPGELSEFVCIPSTGEWIRIETTTKSDIGELAQAPTATATTAAEAPGASSAAPAAPEPTVKELLTDAGKAIDDWSNVGWLAGLIGLINLLLGLLRFSPINDWMTELDYKWIKPLTATLLGATLGGLSTYSTGASVLNSVVAGAMAGLGSIGFHELIDKTRKRTSKAVG